MTDKFAQRHELCKSCKIQEIGTSYVIMEDMFVLGDTMQEMINNLDEFFEAGGQKIQFTNGICIEKNVARKIVQ